MVISRLKSKLMPGGAAVAKSVVRWLKFSPPLFDVVCFQFTELQWWVVWILNHWTAVLRRCLEKQRLNDVPPNSFRVASISLELRKFSRERVFWPIACSQYRPTVSWLSSHRRWGIHFADLSSSVWESVVAPGSLQFNRSSFRSSSDAVMPLNFCAEARNLTQSPTRTHCGVVSSARQITIFPRVRDGWEGVHWFDLNVWSACRNRYRHSISQTQPASISSSWSFAQNFTNKRKSKTFVPSTKYSS